MRIMERRKRERQSQSGELKLNTMRREMKVSDEHYLLRRFRSTSKLSFLFSQNGDA